MTSYSKKKWDKLHRRNPVARELSNRKFRQQIISRKQDKHFKEQVEEELLEYEEDQG